MLKLKDVTIKSGGQLILHECNCRIASNSIIVAKNDVDTEIIALTLAGFRPVNEGEIYITENTLSQNQKSNKKIFFVITEEFGELWNNYHLQEIHRLMKRKSQALLLCEKYNIYPHDSIDSLTNFQKLIYFVSIGRFLGRTIFIFDHPTKYLDYKELEEFNKFLNEEFMNEKYLILTNRFDEIFTSSPGEIYQIDSTKPLILKGGEKNADKQKA